MTEQSMTPAAAGTAECAIAMTEPGTVAITVTIVEEVSAPVKTHEPVEFARQAPQSFVGFVQGVIFRIMSIGDRRRHERPACREVVRVHFTWNRVLPKRKPIRSGRLRPCQT
jgi:hypothetical protein